MYKNLVIATDGSELAGKAVAQGLALAKALAARVTLVTVTEVMPMVSGDATYALSLQDYEQATSANAARILDEASAAARASGITCDNVHVKDRYPAEGIVETAKFGVPSRRHGLAWETRVIEASSWEPGDGGCEFEPSVGTHLPLGGRARASGFCEEVAGRIEYATRVDPGRRFSGPVTRLLPGRARSRERRGGS